MFSVFSMVVLATLMVSASGFSNFYCGQAPGATRSSAAIPPLGPLPQSTAPPTLIQVHAIWRHGDRIPANAAVCWANDTAVWDCSNNMVAGSSSNNSAESVPAAGFVRLSPVEGAMFYPGSCSVGQLTSQGFAQELENGRALASAYIGTLLSPFYSPNEARFEADTSPRVQSSTIAVFQGLYNEATAAIGTATIGAALPVANVFFRDTQTAINCPNLAVCPGLADIVTDFENSTVLANLTSTTIAPMMEYFADALDMELDNPLELMTLFDCYWTHSCHGLPVPDSVQPEDWAALYEGAVDVAQAFFDFPSATATGRLAMGPWVATMAARMEAAIAESDEALRFYGWGSHDLCIMPLLASLGVLGDEWCPYAGMVVFELYELAEGGNAVRVLRYGEAIELPGCGGELCPWSVFAGIMTGLTPSQAECSFVINL